MVHVGAALFSTPFRVFLKEFNVETVEPARRANIERAFAELLDGRDTGERQEEPEVIGEVAVGAGDRFATSEVFGLEGIAVRGQDELGLGAGCCRAGLEGRERLRDLARGGDGDVDVARLKNPAKVGFVGLALAESL